MTVPVPIALRLKGASVDHHVTRELRDLSYAASAPGGYSVASFSLDRSLSATHDDLGSYVKVYAYDRRSGETLWEGDLEDPGRGAGADGEVWALTAVGGAASAHDSTIPLVYIDQSLERATRSSSSRKSMETSIDGETVMIMARRGDNVGSTSYAEMDLLQLAEAGQELALLRVGWDAGVTSNDWLVQALTYPSSNTLRSDTANVAGGATANVAASGSESGVRLKLQRRNSALSVADDATWASFKDVVVVATRYNADGTVKTSGYTHTVVASEIVADLLARLMTRCDGANASIATTTVVIDQLAFYDGIDAAGVLDELLLYHPDHTWAVWESNPDTGLYVFEWYQMPTGAPRFEATARDGYDAPGSAADLYDEVGVRWRSKTGTIKTTVRTQTVPLLADAGIPRRAFIDLSDYSGSAANATQAGDAFLTQHQYPPNGGTLTVNRPILDAVLGRMVQPWELPRLAPGQLVRVRDVAPRQDGLNATDRDGVTVARVVEASYSPSTGAVLSLDSQPRRLDKVIAQARKDIRRQRRR